MVHIPSRAKFQVFLSSEVHITQHQCQATRLRLQPIGLEGGGQLDHEPLDDDRQCGYLTTSSISKHTPNNNPYPKSRQLPKSKLCFFFFYFKSYQVKRKCHRRHQSARTLSDRAARKHSNQVQKNRQSLIPTSLLEIMQTHQLVVCLIKLRSAWLHLKAGRTIPII